MVDVSVGERAEAPEAEAVSDEKRTSDGVEVEAERYAIPLASYEAPESTPGAPVWVTTTRWSTLDETAALNAKGAP